MFKYPFPQKLSSKLRQRVSMVRLDISSGVYEKTFANNEFQAKYLKSQSKVMADNGKHIKDQQQ